MIKKDFSITTFVELKTATGQIIDIQCREEDIPKIKELSELIYRAELPVTKEIKNISHGGYERYTRFNIEQKKYAGGGCGYIECLKINNPPENRNGNIVHEYNSYQSIFYEFDTIENAKKFWEKYWGSYIDNEINFEGFIRKVKCGMFSPWFYAVANQALFSDFAFPNSIGIDHHIYRPFNKFIIEKEAYNSKKEEYEKIPEIKTCIGYDEKEVTSWDSYKKYKEYTIYWTDGTFWSRSSLKDAPKLAETDKIKTIIKTNLCDFVKKKTYENKL